MSVFGFSNISQNLLSNFEIELQDFYWNVFTRINKNIINKKPDKKTELKVDFSNKINHFRGEFILKSGPFNTSAIAHNLLKLLSGNSLVFQDALWKRSLRICCFGCALAAEIVAICKILSNAQECFWNASRRPLHVIVTIIDQDVRPVKTFIKKIFEELENVLDPSVLIISYSFLKIDLENPLNSAVKKNLEKTDVLMMVKLISSMKLQKLSTPVINSFIEKIISTLKVKAVLFFFDTGVNKNLKMVEKFVSSSLNIKCINEPTELEPFMLSLKSLNRCFSLQYEVLNSICLTSQIINSCSWRKIESENTDEVKFSNNISSIKERRQKSCEANRLWNRKKILCQKTLEDYHYEVSKLMFRRTKSLKKKTLQLSDDIEETINAEFDFYVRKNELLFPTKEKSKRIWTAELINGFVVDNRKK